MKLAFLRSLVLIFSLYCSFSSLAQEENDVWMLEDLLSNPGPVNEIVCFQQLYTDPFFWPDDLLVPAKKEGAKVDYFIKTNQGLFIIPDGTSRVYKISKDGKGIQYQRIDSTKYVGYNFNAYHFSFHDTLFSMGGYGFWRTNGHLRYYRPSAYGWEILPLNKEIPLSYGAFGSTIIRVDSKNNKLFYIEKNTFHEGLKNQQHTNNPYTDTTKIFQFDFASRNWKLTGLITKEAAELLNTSKRIISLPMGELILSPPRQTFNIHLLHFSSNRVYLLNKEKASSILDLIHDRAFDRRVMIYVRDSTLHILTSHKEKLIIALGPNDFTVTPISFYTTPETKVVWMGLQGIPLITLLTSITLSVVAIGVITFNIRNRKRQQVPTQLLFDKSELELVHAIFTKPGNAMVMDEINFQLGTSKKSLDVQKKHRSDVIISINEKYKELTGDADKLITQERLETDKRLVKYVINPEKYKKISHLFNSNGNRQNNFT